MDCACIYVDALGYVPSCSSTRMRKARKAHHCGECGRDIKPGELYEYVSGIWDGRPRSYKTCADCESIRDVFFCDGWFYGEILSNLAEHLNALVRYGEIQSAACMTGLTAAAREMVCDAIEDIWSEVDEEGE